MGMCSYCLQREQHECFCWAEARGCGITGPNDPVRLKRKAALDQDKAFALRFEADDLERSTAEKVARLRAEANRLDPRP